MDVYDYAMKMEKDGENYYRDLAVKTGNKGLKHILTMMANAEVKHYHVFQNMKKNEKIPETDAEIMSNVKNVFEKMKEEKETSGVDVSQVELYKKAQDIEKKSQEFYLEKADEVGDPQKNIFLKIADEENKHYVLLKNIIDFVSRPLNWLEDAEWYHLDEY